MHGSFGALYPNAACGYAWSDMGVPVSQMWTVASYVLRQKMSGRKRYPLVLMLEPLFRCNLACAGCGKIQYPAHVLKKNLTPEQCFKAVEECGAPMVSIPGGEPLLHPQIDQIVAGLVAAQEIYLPLHQCPAAEGKDRPVQAEQISHLQRPHGRPEGTPRFCRLPRRRIRHRPRRNPRSRQTRLPRDDQHDAVRRHRSQQRAGILR